MAPEKDTTQVGILVDELIFLEHAVNPARDGDARLGHHAGGGKTVFDPVELDAPDLGEVLPGTFGNAVVARQGIWVGAHVGGTLHIVVTAEDVGATARLAHIAQGQLQDAGGTHHGVADGVLRLGEPTLIILGGAATRGRALELAGSVAAGSACRLATQFFSARIERGAGRVPLERIPYAVPAAVEFLRGFKHLITVETGEPIAFFSYPDQPSVLKQAGCMVHNLTHTDEDSVAGLEMLRDALGHHKLAPPRQARSKEGPPQGALSPASIAHAISAALPDNAILVDESLTTGRETMGLTAGAAPHDVLQNMGGSIGFSTPAATGAALACPDRRVFCMVGDGSAMYTIQSLWTQARESLNVTTIVFANNAYQILRNEFASMKKGGTPGPQALTMMSLENPRIDWVAMGKSMGVPAVAVSSAEEFYRSLMASRGETGPMLIEVRL